MKYRISYILFVLLLSYGVTSAQLTSSNFSIGPRVGVNFSNVSEIDQAKMLTGLALGITSTYSINENSGLTVDALYSQEGYKLSGSSIKFNYLRVPILYNIFFGELGQSFRPKVFLGLQLGSMLSSDMDENELNKFSIGVGAGLGFNYQLQERVWLNTDLRSFFELNPLSKSSSTLPDKTKIRNIHLSIGIAWGI